MLKGYEVKEKMEDGSLYAVVELEDGTTFGQIVSNAVTVEDVDAAITDAVKRVTKGEQVTEVDALIGNYRSLEGQDELQNGR